MDNLNEQYFETRKKHRANHKKKKLTLSKAMINLIITVVLIYVFTFFQNYLNKKIEENKINKAIIEYND